MAGCRKSPPKMCERYLCRGACSGRSRNGSGRGTIGTDARTCPKVSFEWQAPRYTCRGRCNIFARSTTNFVAAAGFSQCWHGHIANPICTDVQRGTRRFRGRRSTCQRSGTDFAAGTTLSQGRVRFRGTRSTLARSGTDFVASAALSQG